MISAAKARLLQGEVANVQRFLAEFEPPADGGLRIAQLSKSQELLIVKGFPLPDGFVPDSIDMLLGVSDYPATPPIGIYVLNQHNGAALTRIQRVFNVFADNAYHDADPVPGYTWICYAYASNRWQFNARHPNKGDNIGKFLSNFFAHLESDTGKR